MDRVQGAFVADDMIEIVALPDGIDRGVLAKPFGDADFESAHNRTDGF